MRPPAHVRATGQALLLAGFAICLAVMPEARSHEAWSQRDVATLASMRLGRDGQSAADPSNAYEKSAGAVTLGRALFHDARFSASGKVSCASCHSGDQFTDSLALAQGIGTGSRRTMPVMGAADSPFLFWDGRKDSLWSQALGPLEDAREHGGNRVGIARLMASQYRVQYEKVFGEMPDVQSLPAGASPVGTPAERDTWEHMPESSRADVNGIFANMGKAIAAFERTIRYGESRFDQYVDAVAAGKAANQQVLSQQEVRGLRVFLTRGQCVTCHNGPLLTDHAFHNTGIPAAGTPDEGRYEGIRKLMRDEFNCLGRFSDAKPGQCTELLYLSEADSSQAGAFRTPGLRNVAARPPYMHAGQFGTLEAVIEHYRHAPQAATGRSEISARVGSDGRIAIRLSSADSADLTAFLRTLTGPVDQAGQ